MWCGSGRFWYALGVAGVLAGLWLPGPSRADEKGKKDRPRKDGGGKGEIIRIDLGKLPPGLAKVLRKYAEDDRRRDKGYSGGSSRSVKNKGKKQAGLKPKDKARAAQGKGKQGGARGLPPGLAKKAPDHPGRRAYLRSHPAQHPKKMPPGKGKPDGRKSGKKKTDRGEKGHRD